MDLAIGLVLLIYCIGASLYTYFFGGDFSDLRTLLQLLVSGVGFMIILGPIVLKKVKNIKLPKIPNIIPEKEKEMDLPDCDDQVIMDTECLHYLKHRAFEIGSEEAMQMVVKLNSILFSDTCKKEEKQNAEKDK